MDATQAYVWITQPLQYHRDAQVHCCSGPARTQLCPAASTIPLLHCSRHAAAQGEQRRNTYGLHNSCGVIVDKQMRLQNVLPRKCRGRGGRAARTQPSDTVWLERARFKDQDLHLHWHGIGPSTDPDALSLRPRDVLALSRARGEPSGPQPLAG